MATTIVGADPQALHATAAQFREDSLTLLRLLAECDRLLSAMSWTGGDHVSFTLAWQYGDRLRLCTAAESLRDAATHLDRQAREQEETSAPAESGGTTIDVSSALSSELSNLSTYVGAAELRAVLAIGDEAVALSILRAIRTLQMAKLGLDVDLLLSDLVADLAEHPDLPADERAVHAVTEAALRYGADKGLTQLGQWGGAALLGLIAGPAAIVGRAAGFFVGRALAVIFRAVDSGVGLTSAVADTVVNLYRDVRDEPLQTLRRALVLTPFPNRA